MQYMIGNLITTQKNILIRIKKKKKNILTIKIYLLPLRDGISYAWPMKHRNTRLMSHRFGTYKTLASTLESDMLENLKFIWNHSRKTIKKKNMSKKDDLKPYTLPLQCCHCIFRCERWTCSKILNECGQWPLIKSALTLLAKCMHVMNKWWRGHTCGAQILCLF